MCTLLALLTALTESTNPGGAGVVSRGQTLLMPVQKAQIAKYALASSNKAAILLRYMKEFQKMSSR